ncbi:MAG: N-6 DNA methylase, partial [Fidelibacterota bacterium]
MIRIYLKEIAEILIRGDAREESYYPALKSFLEKYGASIGKKKIAVTVLPKKTEAGNPDFRVWDGEYEITGYIEAKAPGTKLGSVVGTDQLKRYLKTFPNLILTNFYEFRLYRNGIEIDRVSIGRPFISQKLKTIPPVEHKDEFKNLLNKFFGFVLPAIENAETLAKVLAGKTHFLKDEVVAEELKEETAGSGDLVGFYAAFQKYLISNLSRGDFADLFSQTLAYGLFAARTRATDGFNRKLAYDYIPVTIGILRDVFRFVSSTDLSTPLEVMLDDIAEVLQKTNVKKILQDYYRGGKGEDPVVHFYETFLNHYDPKKREKRGVYYTPLPVVHYIVRSLHYLLKSKFKLEDGLAAKEVKLLDPAGGTLTFPVEAIKLAVKEFITKYGEGGKHALIKNQLLRNYFAFELMMAPYAIGHMKIGFILEELGYKMEPDDRFNLYLTNTLDMEDLGQTTIPIIKSLSEENRLAGKVKKEKPILVILGNPPYSGISANINEWTEKLLKEDLDGAQSYYSADGKPLGERNPKWLQDDYVKFLRFAQWKIHKAGKGVVGMITNHSYLDNPTFRGMRQSLMKTFDEIYILDLHGNSLKKETCPDGSPDQNVFDIRQGVAIALFVKNKPSEGSKPSEGYKVFHADLWGKREKKYQWLESHYVKSGSY